MKSQISSHLIQISSSLSSVSKFLHILNPHHDKNLVLHINSYNFIYFQAAEKKIPSADKNAAKNKDAAPAKQVCRAFLWVLYC